MYIYDSNTVMKANRWFLKVLNSREYNDGYKALNTIQLVLVYDNIKVLLI